MRKKKMCYSPEEKEYIAAMDRLHFQPEDMQLCKLSPVQAMKLTKMHQKRLLPYLICK